MQQVEVGKKVGMWTILSKSQNKSKTSRAIVFQCLCDCGNERPVRKDCLRQGQSMSCGCKKNGPVMDKIFSNIKKNENDCWLWTGGISVRGYARMYYKGKSIPLHRLSYMLFKGPIPEDKLACHTCDNKKCINPDHIYVGTHKTNIKDAKDRNLLRTRIGSSHPSSKLNDDKVKYIRFHHKIEISVKEMASFFNVKPTIIYNVVRGKRWKHVK